MGVSPIPCPVPVGLYMYYPKSKLFILAFMLPSDLYIEASCYGRPFLGVFLWVFLYACLCVLAYVCACAGLWVLAYGCWWWWVVGVAAGLVFILKDNFKM